MLAPFIRVCASCNMHKDDVDEHAFSANGTVQCLSTFSTVGCDLSRNSPVPREEREPPERRGFPVRAAGPQTATRAAVGSPR
eukprot:6289748-Alexandrium_andersonii.AAC.1